MILEVDKSEIPNFTHFIVVPHPLEWGREIFSNIVRPTCETENCPIGAEMRRPVRLSTKKSKKIGIAQIGRPWNGRICELLLSPRVKELFDSHTITGLQYERCLLDDGDWLAEPDGPTPYLATVKSSGGQEADDILIKEFCCQKHRIISSFCLFGDRTPLKALSPDDFQLIDRVAVKGEVYYYWQTQLAISRRVLQLLLQHKIRGLTPQSFYLDEKFVPLVTTPACKPTEPQLQAHH